MVIPQLKVIKMPTHKSPLVLGKELVQFLDEHRGEKSRNAFIVQIIREYKALLASGIVTEAGVAV